MPESNAVFNEQSLYNDIVEKWGEYGAHADVYRTILKILNNYKACIDQVKTLNDYRMYLGYLASSHKQVISHTNEERMREEQ